VADRTTVRGCCPLDCQDTCSWVAHVERGRVVRVEGDKHHPFTRGALCAKVNDYQERTYSSDRVLYPLRRIGAKGEGRFERTSWDDALALVADRFTEIANEHGPEALLPINYLGSMGVVQRRALMRVFNALGASTFHGSVCGAAGNVLEAEGHPRGFDPEELSQSRLVLLWGTNLLTTSHHHWHFVDVARKEGGARLVCIDPIATRTAKACDEHVSLRPGSDCVLAAGLMRVVLTEGLADAEFVDTVVADLDELHAQVDEWTPERVADVTDVPPGTVVRLARELAATKPATIRGGVGPQQTVNGEAFVRALSALALVCGLWRLPGGGLFIETNPILHESVASRADLRPAPARSLDLARLGEHLTSEELEPPVKGLMVWGMNPAAVLPDVGTVRRGLARDDLFTVVLEHFVTDTARYADLVLPSTTQLEHFDLVGAWGHHYISLNEQAIPPLGEALSHGEVMRRLAVRLGLDRPALRETDEEIAASSLPEGTTIDDLRSAPWTKTGPARPDLLDGRPRLRVAAGVPTPELPPDEASLQLLTPKAHYLLNTSFANMPRQRASMRRPTLDIHPEDARTRGVEDGSRVEIRNDQGSLRVHARITEGIHRGTVALPGKWWHEPDGASANLLTPPRWAPGGQPAYNDTFVHVLALPDEEAVQPEAALLAE
jgi:anaerobic selenocysteine-containing dehydrogenase